MKLGVYLNAQHPQSDDPARRFAEIAHSGDLDLVFRRIAIRCRERVGRSVTAPSGGLADLSIQIGRASCRERV